MPDLEAKADTISNQSQPSGAIGRLEYLRNVPPLKLSVEGGGIEETQSILPEMLVLVSRADLDNWLHVIRTLMSEPILPPAENPEPKGTHAIRIHGRRTRRHDHDIP